MRAVWITSTTATAISRAIYSRRAYEFGDSNSLSGMFMNSTRNTNIVCLRYNGDPATTLPCGYGPTTPTAATSSSTRSPTMRCSARRSCRRRSTRWTRAACWINSTSTSNGLPSPSGFSSNHALDRLRPSTRRCPRSSGTRSRFKPTARRRSSRRRRWFRRSPSFTTAASRPNTTCCRRPTRSIPAISSR